MLCLIGIHRLTDSWPILLIVKKPDTNRLTLQIFLVAKTIWKTRKKVFPAILDWLSDLGKSGNIPLGIVNRIYKATSEFFINRIVIIYGVMKADVE